MYVTSAMVQNSLCNYVMFDWSYVMFLDISANCDPGELDLTHVMQMLGNEIIEGLPPGGGLSSK